jgi:hypothetical protein
MTTVKAFDEMMGQFIGELAQVFPDESPKTPIACSDFMRMIAPWISQMSARNDSFFCAENEVVKHFGLDAIWAREDCSQSTKQAIWQYFSSLYMIATTLSMFPPETLSMIESAAENCAKNMKLGPSGQIDEAALMSGVNSMLSQMLSSPGGNPFAALTSPGGGRRQVPSGPQPRRKVKKSSK